MGRRGSKQGDVVMEEKFVEIMDASCAKALDFDSFVAKWSDTVDGSDESKTRLVGHCSMETIILETCFA